MFSRSHLPTDVSKRNKQAKNMTAPTTKLQKANTLPAYHAARAVTDRRASDTLTTAINRLIPFPRALLTSATSSRYSCTQHSSTPLHIEPAQILFSNFNAMQKYEMTLSILNCSHQKQYVRIVRPESSVFSLSAPKGPSSTSMIAPGLSLTYVVYFQPANAQIDYSCELTVITEHDNYIIPVHAFANRGKLELPDTFAVNDAPLRGSSRSSLFIRNCSSVECVWRAEVIASQDENETICTKLDNIQEKDTECKTNNNNTIDDAHEQQNQLVNNAANRQDCTNNNSSSSKAMCNSFFSISPCRGTFAPDSTVTPLEVTFAPTYFGTHNCTVRFFLGLQEDMIQEMTLTGNGIEVPVLLEPSQVEFNDLFITTESESVVKVCNDSSFPLHFAWKNNFLSYTAHGGNTLLNVDVVGGDDVNGETNCEAKIAGAVIDSDTFDDEVFSIEPSCGVMQANSTREFTIHFNPQLAICYETTAFLELTGRRDRIPLLLRGSGVGPQCQLEFTKLHIGDVYMHALHEYCVTIENVGCIEARYVVLPPSTHMGKYFTFSPSRGVLSPSASEMLTIQFESPETGEIAEKFKIHLHGSTDDLTLEFRGTVVGPTFEFDVNEIEFGDVSFAFTHTRTFQVHNTSHVPLAYQFHFPSTYPLSSLFAIRPSSGCIAPMGSHDVSVEFCPVDNAMTLGKMESVLEMDVIGIADRQARLPIKVNCVVPALEFSTNVLNFNTCFLGHTYTQQLAVTNTSSLPCKFTVIEMHSRHDDFCDGMEENQKQKLLKEQKEEEPYIRNEEFKEEESPKIVDMGLQEHHVPTCTITLDAIADGNAATSDNNNKALRVVGAHETTYISIQLCAHAINSFERTLAIYAAGTAPEQAQLVTISGIGCGPDVRADVNSILFGTIPVLTQLTKFVTLHNNSLIPAEVELTIKPRVSASNTLLTAANESKSTIGKRESKVSSHTSTSQRTASIKLQNREKQQNTVQRTRQASTKDQKEELQKEEEQEQEKQQEQKATEKAVKYESIFVIEPTCVVIEPNSSTQISITALPNDAMTFSQEIECIVKHNESAPIHVNVKCTGSGFPLVVREPDSITDVDFNEIFTENSVTKEVVLENKGRRTLELQWHNVRGTKAKEGAAPIVFTYKPERASIAPRECAKFTIEGFSNEVGKFVEHFVLKQSGTFREVMKSCVSGEFIAPTLKFSVKELVFDYVHNVHDVKDHDKRVTVLNNSGGDDNECSNKITEANDPNRHASSTTTCELYRSLTMQNMTNHKLHIKMKLQDKNGPFALDEHALAFTLNGGESQVVSVRFNPLYRGDYVSHAIGNRLLISFDSHAQVEKVKINASVLFPSLCFSPALQEIDFGAILVDSEVRKTIKLVNESAKLPARFTWNLIDIMKSSSNNDNTISEKNNKLELEDMSITPNVVAQRVFDFVPFKGEIAPNASLEVYVVFNGKAGKHCMNATCQIHGGPSLPLRLCGEASVLNVSFDKTVLDFGVMPYYSKVTKSIIINNVSHVPTSFNVITQSIKHHGSVMVSPMSGTITDKVRLNVTFCPTVPDTIEEEFTIHVGHCDPQIIHVNGAGIVHTLSVLGMDSNVPVQRNSSRVFASFLACLRNVAHSCEYYHHNTANDSGRSSMVSSSETINSSDDMNSDHDVYMRYGEVLEQCQLLSLSQLQEVGTTPYLQRVMKTEQQQLNLIDVCEKEAERLTFVQHILQLQEHDNLRSFKDTIDSEEIRLTTISAGKQSTMNLLTSEEELESQQKKEIVQCNGLSNNNVPSTQAMPLQRVMRRISTSAMDSANHKYVLSCYTIDFGHLTRTAIRSTRIKLLNTSLEPLYVSIDGKEISHLPITVWPLKLPKIAPMQSATLEITLDASGNSIEKVDSSNNNNNNNTTMSGNNVNTIEDSNHKNKNKHTVNANSEIATGGEEAARVAAAMDGNKVINNFKSGKIKAGENKFEFVLDIKGGPAVVLRCRCYIATPSLRINPAELVFGELVIGQARIMPLTLYNEQAVPCTWVMTCKEHAISYSINSANLITNAKKTYVSEFNRKETNAMETSELNTPQFWCNQLIGTVPPLSSQTVEIYFAPHKAGEMSATLHFRFVKNNVGKGVEVKCTGAGKMLNVEITPAIHFPTMKPFEILREPFTIVNHESFPVEVVSLNHDGRHARECELLHNALYFQSVNNLLSDSSNNNNNKSKLQTQRELLLAPLHAGDYLPLDVLNRLHGSLEKVKNSICNQLNREEEEEKTTRSLSTSPYPQQHYEQRQNDEYDEEKETDEVDKERVTKQTHNLASRLGAQKSTNSSTNSMQKTSSAVIEDNSSDEDDNNDDGTVNAVEMNDENIYQNNVEGKSTQFIKNSSTAQNVPNCFTVLIGPPQSGKTCMAQVLAEKYKLHRIDLNELIAHAAANDSITGAAIRQILESNRTASQTPVALASTHHLISHRDNLEEFVSPYDQMQNSAQEVLEQLNELENVMFGNSAFCVSTAQEAQHTRLKKSKEIDSFQEQQQQQQHYIHHSGNNSNGVMNMSTMNNKQKTTLRSNEEHLRNTVMDEGNNTINDNAICIPVIIRRLLVEYVRKVISCCTPSRGFVMDGLTCCLTNDALSVFKIVQSICTRFELPVRIVSLAISEPAMALRVVNDEITHCRQRVRNAEMQPLSENEYDTLSPEQQLSYNIRLQHLNVLRRELATKQASKERLEEQLASLDDKTSVQSKVEHEWHTSQDMELTTRTMRKSIRRITPVEAAPIHWETLSPLQLFKILYAELIKQYEVIDAVQLQNTLLTNTTTMNSANTTSTSQHPTPVNSGRSTQSSNKKSSNHANSKNALLANKSTVTHDLQTNIIYSVNAEQMKTTLANDIICVLRRASTSEVAQQGENKPQEIKIDTDNNHNNENGDDMKDGSNANNVNDNVTSVNQPLGSGIQVILDSNGSMTEDELQGVSKSHIGTWYYVNESRLRLLALNPLEHVHFFAAEECDVVMPPKKNMKTKLSTTIHTFREMTRWVIPAHSALDIYAELCCDELGELHREAVFAIVGSLQKLKLSLNGRVVVPDVDRDERHIFPQVRNRLPMTGVHLPKWYVSAKKCYNFGALLIPPPTVSPSRRRRSEIHGEFASSTSTSSSSSSANNNNSSNSRVGSGRPNSAIEHSAAAAAVLPTYSEKLTFGNNGLTATEITLQFTNDKDKTFTVNPTHFVLETGVKQEVTLTANPERLGEIRNTLVACVKDNPLTWSAEVMCTGTRPSISINDENKKEVEVDFGRTVLHRSLEKLLTLRNTSRMPIHWHINGLDKLPAEMSLSESSGIIDADATCQLRLLFTPHHTCLYTVPLTIVVTDATQPRLVYEQVMLALKAEGNDVVIEWTRNLDFGLMHVKETRHDCIRILNKSPYEIAYLLRLPKRLQGILTLNPLSGTIRGMLGYRDAALSTIDVTACFPKEGEIPEKLGQIEVAFFDKEKQELLYPLQTIKLCGEAWYSKFTVKPMSIDFGSCFYSQRKQATFELHNTGRFPINFALYNGNERAARREIQVIDVSAAQDDSGEAGLINSSKKSKITTNTSDQGMTEAELESKEKDSDTNLSLANTMANLSAATSMTNTSRKPMNGKRSKSDNEFQMGCFTVSPSRGVVSVNEVLTFTVVTVPEKTSKTHEVLGIYVEDCEPVLEERGVLLDLIARPATPAISANLNSNSDIETIFEEQQVVVRLDQYDKCLRAYGREDRTFTFGTVLVNHRVEERFRIANSSSLPCNVNVQVQPANLTISAALSMAMSVSSKNMVRPDAFDLGLRTSHTMMINDKAGVTNAGSNAMYETHLILPPFESRFVSVGFTPTSMQRFDARFVAMVENSNESSNNNVLMFTVTGDGTLPNVEYILPPPLPKVMTLPKLNKKTGGAGGNVVFNSMASSPHAPSLASTVNSVNSNNSNNYGSGSSSHVESSGTSKTTSGSRGRSRDINNTSATSLSLSLTSSMPSLSGNRKNVSSMMMMPAGLTGSFAESDVAHMAGDGVSVMEMPLTLVKSSTSRSFRVRNTGKVPADIHLRVLSESSVANGLHINKRDSDITIPVGEEEEFTITYAPSEVGKAFMKVHVLLAENPFESREIVIEGQSYSQAISFREVVPTTCDYVDFGDCYVNEPKTMVVYMRNNTATLLRYEWSSEIAHDITNNNKQVQIVPERGHLSAYTEIPIKVTLTCNEVGLQQVHRCNLIAQTIELCKTDELVAHSTTIAGDWNSSLTSQKWVVANDAMVLPAIHSSYVSNYASATSINTNDLSLPEEQASQMTKSNYNKNIFSPSSPIPLPATRTSSTEYGRRNLKRILEPVPEPPYVIVGSSNNDDDSDGNTAQGEANAFNQTLRIGFSCDRPRFDLMIVDANNNKTTPCTSINFATTKIFQRRIATMRVANTGNVSLPFEFEIRSLLLSPSQEQQQLSTIDYYDNMPNVNTTIVDEMQQGKKMNSMVRVDNFTSSNNNNSNDEEAISAENMILATLEKDNKNKKMSNTISNSAITTCPFKVHPTTGCIAAGQSHDIAVTFAPMIIGESVNEFMLHGHFPFSTREDVDIALRGSGECSLVHFHIPCTNYLQTRIDGEAGLITDRDTPVLELLTRGLHSRTTVRFKVVNPTSSTYAFEWREARNNNNNNNGNNNNTDLTSSNHTGNGNNGNKMIYDSANVMHSTALSPFRCLTNSGTIAAGKKLEMGFEFSADTLGVREELWSFHIMGKTTVPFLLVGKAIEPVVYFNTSKVNFNAVHVHCSSERVVFLDNRDDSPLSFAFSTATLNATSTFLVVKPVTGTIASKEKLPITIVFTPRDEMEYNVPLVCNVKRVSTPLTINVKGEGICIHDALQIEFQDELEQQQQEVSNKAGALRKVNSMSNTVLGSVYKSSTMNMAQDVPLQVAKNQLTMLDLGRVQVEDYITRRLVLSNNGQCAFDYDVSATTERRFISLSNTNGTIYPRQRAVVLLTYRPLEEEVIKHYRLCVKIADKVHYTLALHAIAYIPKVNFSSSKVDFGPRFIAEYNMENQITYSLVITNTEKETITIDCNLTEGNDWCEVDTVSIMAQPMVPHVIKFTFTPQEVGVYDDKLRLLLNGIYALYLPITGEGVIPRVDVLNHFAKLGVARIGEHHQVEMRLECRSKIMTPVSFVNCVDEDLVNKGISIAPNDVEFVLRPREVRVVTLHFTPVKRMGEFQREMMMHVCGREFPFALLTGACEDSEIHLDVNTLRFNDVVIGSSATRRLVIMNSGDISQKFSWNLGTTNERMTNMTNNSNSIHKLNQYNDNHGEAHITVSPQTGFVRSHTECVCEFRYTPTRAMSFINRTITIAFDSSAPITVTIEGNCVARPPCKECVSFHCKARETCTNTVKVSNPFTESWTFVPEFDSPLFTGPKSVTLKPKSEGDVVITYAPMKPTTREQWHATSIDSNTSDNNAPRQTNINKNSTTNSNNNGNLNMTRRSIRFAQPQTTTTTSNSITDRSSETEESRNDLAQMFIALPDGSGLTFELVGTAELPGPSGPTQEITIECNTTKAITFNVQNWTLLPLRFTREVRWSSVIEDGVLTLKGASGLEIAPQEHKDYVLSLSSVREGEFAGTVYFRCIDKPDVLQYYDIILHVISAQASSTITLNSPVRTLHVYKLPVTNPLPKPITVQCKVEGSAADCVDVPPTLTIGARSTARLAIEFFPLIEKEFQPARLSLSSAELGTTWYTLKLSATQARYEKITRLVCPLGQSIPFTLSFTHYCKSSTDFAIRISQNVAADANNTNVNGNVSSTFSGSSKNANNTGAALSNANRGHPLSDSNSNNKNVVTITRVGQGMNLKAQATTRPKGQDMSAEFSYEPCRLGSSREMVTFTSALGGVYVFPILCVCTEPQRQGPVIMRVGQNVTIPFKNVFLESITVAVSTDSSRFVVTKKTETIPPKKSVNIVVQCKQEESGAITINEHEECLYGKLSVLYVSPRDSAPLEWIYYLEAMRTDVASNNSSPSHTNSSSGIGGVNINNSARGVSSLNTKNEGRSNIVTHS